MILWKINKTLLQVWGLCVFPNFRYSSKITTVVNIVANIFQILWKCFHNAICLILHKSKCQLSKFTIGHIWYINIQAWLHSFRVKIAKFSSLFCPSIPKRDFDTKKTTPNIEVWPESLRVMLEYWYIEHGLLVQVCFICQVKVSQLPKNMDWKPAITAH